MVNGIRTIFMKECRHFFCNLRMFLTTVILPGVLLFIIYTMMGKMMGGEINDQTAGEGMISFYSIIIPLVLIIFLFIGCISAASESVAGEKERKTIATILATPVKRHHIAIGKILALSVIAVLSGLSSAAGLLLSLPGISGISIFGTLNTGLKECLMILGIVIVTALPAVSLVSIISASARSVKEAQAFSLPLIIIIMAVCMAAVMGGFSTDSGVIFMIPVYNSVLCIRDLFAGAAADVNIVITVIMNLLYAALEVIILSRIFCSEKMIFGE